MKNEYEVQMDEAGLTAEEKRQQLVGWYDATVNAAYWFRLAAVNVLEAAQILSCVNPHDPEQVDGWLDTTSWKDHSDGVPIMRPEHRRNLKRGLEGVGGERPLCEWLQIAIARGWRYDPWVDAYIEAAGLRRFNGSAGDLLQQPSESTVQRRARRWQSCVDAGLCMPTNTYGHFPRGIGKVADAEGITRQSFTDDLKAHREALFGR